MIKSLPKWILLPEIVSNNKQQIQFFFKIRNKGDLQLSLLLKNNDAELDRISCPNVDSH